MSPNPARGGTEEGKVGDPIRAAVEPVVLFPVGRDMTSWPDSLSMGFWGEEARAGGGGGGVLLSWGELGMGPRAWHGGSSGLASGWMRGAAPGLVDN